MAVSTWANGFGVWHVRVDRDSDDVIQEAREMLRTEITTREARADAEVWRSPVRLPDMDDERSIVYREGDPAVTRCPDCNRPITLNPTGWWSHDSGIPDDCWRVSMDGPDYDISEEDDD